MEVKTLQGKTEVGKPLTDSLECGVRESWGREIVQLLHVFDSLD